METSRLLEIKRALAARLQAVQRTRRRREKPERIIMRTAHAVLLDKICDLIGCKSQRPRGVTHGFAPIYHRPLVKPVAAEIPRSRRRADEKFAHP